MVEKIYSLLTEAGMSKVGALAMLGNMECESSMRADNAQDSMQKCSDSEYTEIFNTKPEECYADGCGYGLCQWTHPTRKRNLRQFAENWGVSVDAEDMQTEFAIYELKTEYAQLWQYLCRTNNLYEATAKICREYEHPAVNNIAARYAAAQKYAFLAEKHEEELDICLYIIQAVLAAMGYEVSITGKGDSKTAAALKKYTEKIGER